MTPDVAALVARLETERLNPTPPPLPAPAGPTREWMRLAGAHDPERRGGMSVDLDDLVALLAPPPGLDTAWQDLAVCAQTDPEAFYPELGGTFHAARRVCAGCEVREQCLEYALAAGEQHGMWGGLSPRERRELAADRVVAA